MRLDHAVGGVEPAVVDQGQPSGEVIVIVRDTLERIVRGRATLRGSKGERIELPRLGQEAKPIGGVALRVGGGQLVALLDAKGRVYSVTSSK